MARNFPSEARSAAAVRQFVRGAVGELGDRVASEDAVLLASELAANAIRHAAGERFSVAVRRQPDGTMEIGVTDADPRPLAPALAPPDATGGRGLPIVDVMARRWGVRRAPGGGKCVWFDL